MKYKLAGINCFHVVSATIAEHVFHDCNLMNYDIVNQLKGKFLEQTYSANGRIFENRYIPKAGFA